MARVAIVTDSTAYIPQEIAKKLGISVVPLNVQWNGSVYDEADPNALEVVEALRNGELATTSRPSPERFSVLYDRLAQSGAMEIVSIHISSSMSGTSEAAELAAKSAPIPVHILDSRTVGMAMGYGVIAAALAADEGMSGIEVIEIARRRIAATNIFFSVAKLENLRRSGRISRGASLLATALAIKPILTVEDGHVVAQERVRTQAGAIKRLEEMAIEATRNRAVDVAVHHLGAAALAEKFAADLRAVLSGVGQVVITEVGAVVGTHVGPGAIAVVIAPRI
ncbi:MAG: DegV family protein [Actinobacteria bacterium]|nr:DegV family protein [Actinomycetota bacterium]